MQKQQLLTLAKAAAAQTLGLALTIALAAMQPGLFDNIWLVLLTQGFAAALWAKVLRQPIWWLAIHLLFWPAALSLLVLQLPVWLYLALLLLMTLVFWSTANGDVPLFLSSAAVADAVGRIAEQENAMSLAELGAGIGSVFIPLTQRRPAMTITAFEHAPLPWLIARWRSRMLARVKVLRTSFWHHDLADYDTVFAFLSPAVMARLGEKISREMRSGSLFISSSFPIPDWQPETIIPIENGDKTSIFCYRIK